MAKKVMKVLTLQINAGAANPAPPIGTALGPLGINIMEFVKTYNERTASMTGSIIPAQITVFEDRSFTFVLRTPPASDLLRKAAGIAKGGNQPRKVAVGSITQDQLREIAQTKLPDLNTKDMTRAMQIIDGTARSMGIEVK